MTLATTVRSTPPTRPARPGPRALSWVTWRQHRLALIVITGVLASVSVFLLWRGMRMHTHFAQLKLSDCVPGGQGQRCSSRLDTFSPDQTEASELTAVLMVLPVLFGLFIGAPLLAREYESGTYRFAFTQGAGRTRWLVTKIVLLAAFTVVVTVALTFVVAWWYGPLAKLNGRLGVGNVYEVYGLVPVGRALFALAAGILAGAVARRVVPAIAVTLAVWVAVVASSMTLLRRHLQTPLRVDGTQVPGHPWVLRESWFAPSGQQLTGAEVNDLEYNSVLAGHKLDMFGYLTGQHYHYIAYYQPANRLWTFQSLEAGGLAVLAAVLLVVAVRLVRRRAA